jgi:hypothetical protein
MKYISIKVKIELYPCLSTAPFRSIGGVEVKIYAFIISPLHTASLYGTHWTGGCRQQVVAKRKICVPKEKQTPIVQSIYRSNRPGSTKYS